MRYKWYVPWLFIFPTILGLLAFRIVPILTSFVMAFTDWSPFGSPNFIGLENFEYLFEAESEFYEILKNTIIYSVLFVPGVMASALGLALLVNQKLKGAVFFRVLFFTPVITSTVAIGIVWQWIFGTDLGALNFILRSVFRIEDPPSWMNEAAYALPIVAFVYIFKRVGYYMIIYLAGLQDIPGSFKEASSIDGANRWQIFRRITLPLLTPTSFFILIIAIIDSFKSLEIIYTMTRGGPGLASTTLSYYIYQNAFLVFQLGYASAVSIILLAVIGIITALNFYFKDRWVQYKY
ncbi:ABC transporter permease [candidate division KSB3 bacterium]|uniref:ABC transporter permease n=1 Tax=candidate division KSB3 bacterium TaxID=2044937 RepID=A0A2G6K8C3_9BACT|nr:MAG: ABC transporter permease [candidate division KSB3 bacterium]